MAKILVADDNSNIQKMVGLALRDQGIDVVAVGNGEAAVRKISDVHPDLVLADVFMPVRNGYEVCRYVKEDSALSHIPVILLVGAFDPLDEQEAQRVGADGVLKKPFVPPDPLISMVKSALTRAGVSLGPAAAPAPEKAAPSRSGAEILSGGVGAKLPAAFVQNVPPPEPEPIEEFPTPPLQVKIPEGAGPVAFGSLLGSAETEEEPAVFSSKPMINISAKNEWDEPKDVPEEEDDEETAHRAWRANSLEEEPAHADAESQAGASDWRDTVFAEASSAPTPSTAHWTPTSEKTGLAEAAEVPAVAVSTLETKRPEPVSPFASDAWATALAAGVEQKLEESDAHAPAEAPSETPTFPQTSPKPVNGEFAAEHAKPSEPAPVVPESSWEAEARRASMLASTWDAAPTRPPDETQDVPAYSAEQHAEPASVHSSDTVPAEPSAYSGHFEHEHGSLSHADTAPQEPAAPSVSDATLSKPWETTAIASPDTSDVAPRQEFVHDAPSEPAQEIQSAIDSLAAPADQEPVTESSDVQEAAEQTSASVSQPEPIEEAASAPTTAPNMDELVTRVLAKMNPDVLQKVTREILKPVIEAIVRDELDSKKS